MIAAVSRVFAPELRRPTAATSPFTWLALGTVYLVWGSTYLGIRLSLDGVPPFFMGAVRFILAGALLAAWVVARGEWRAIAARPAEWL